MFVRLLRNNQNYLFIIELIFQGVNLRGLYKELTKYTAINSCRYLLNKFQGETTPIYLFLEFTTRKYVSINKVYCIKSQRISTIDVDPVSSNLIWIKDKNIKLSTILKNSIPNLDSIDFDSDGHSPFVALRKILLYLYENGNTKTKIN